MSAESIAPDGIRLHARETQRTGRFAVIGAEPEHAARIWIVLHGYGQLSARFLRPFAGIVPEDTCVIAPEGLSRFYLEAPRVDGGHLQRVGATWLTREGREDEIRDAHRWLSAVCSDAMERSTAARQQRPTLGVLAFSQGVATAMRWMAAGEVHAAAVVLWAGGLAHDVDATALRDALENTTLTLVAGTDDPFATVDARAIILAAARAVHPSPEELVFAGAHHLDASILETLLRGLATPNMRPR